jgi:hypothetical protein
MLHNFENIDHFLFLIEKEIIDCLYEYKLLSKLDRNAKKIIFYIFVKRFGDRISNDKDLLFCHDNIFSESHELFIYYSREKLTNFLNRICKKLKSVTNHIFFLKNKINIPDQALVNDLEGSVIDEVLLLKNKTPVDPQKLKSFLHENSLKDLFCNLSKKVC